MEAARIAKRQMAGGGMAHMMNHEAPAPLRNHARQNILAIREKERQLRGKRVMEGLKMPDEPFKLKQFANAKSRLGPGAGRSSPSHALGPGTGEPLGPDRPVKLSADALAHLEKTDPLAALVAGAGKRSASMPIIARAPRPSPEPCLADTAKRQVSFSSSCMGADAMDSIDAVLQDAAGPAAIQAVAAEGGAVAASAAAPSSVRGGRPPRPAAAMEQDEMDLETFEAQCEELKRKYGNQSPNAAKKSFKKDAGGRPAYLNRIKANLAEEQRRNEDAKRGPEVPPGYRVLPASEREETLGALRSKRAELEKEYQKLPLHIQTDGQRRREKMVLDKIKESDEAITLFSQQRVLVET